MKKLAWVLLAGCAVVAPLRPELPLETARAQALKASTTPFTASQHLVFFDGHDRRESSALFFVSPGEAYRLRVLGPLGMVAFDVQARCGRYQVLVPSQNKKLVGDLSHPEVSFFPVADMFVVLRPVSGGTWQGDDWTDGERHARLDRRQGAFSRIENHGLVVEMKAFTDASGMRLPRTLEITLPKGKHLHIDNAEVSTDAPAAEQMVGDVKCGSP